MLSAGARRWPIVIGFIGLGHMGGAIAHRLIDTGAKLVVFDTTPSAIHELAAAGAVVATSTRDVANQAEIVFVCLPSPEISIQVARDSAGGAALGIYVEMSTIGRSAIDSIAEVMSSKKVILLDAPVSGGPRSALLGSLSIMMAGPAAAMDQVTGLLGDVATKIFRVSEKAGDAQICKLVNNAIAFTAFVVSCETIAVGVANGIDPTMLVDVVNAGSGRNSGTTDKFPLSILPRTFNSGASLASGIKDMDLYLSEAAAAGMPPAIAACTRELWMQALGALDPTKDFTTIIRYFESFVGTEVAARSYTDET